MAIALSPFSATVLTYVAGAIICVIAFGNRSREHTMGAASLRLGPQFVAIALAVFGTQHLVFAESVASIVPPWMPGRMFWALFVGVCLIAASVSLVVQKCDAWAAASFGVMLLLFEVLMHIPNIIAAPKNRFTWMIAIRDLTYASGALSFAVFASSTVQKETKLAIIGICRVLIGGGALYFGMMNLIHPEFIPGAPTRLLTPLWFPARLLWSYVVGAFLVLMASFLIFDKDTERSAKRLGLASILLAALVYLPILLSQLSSVSAGLNPLVNQLLFGGSVLCFWTTQQKKAQVAAR